MYFSSGNGLLGTDTTPPYTFNAFFSAGVQNVYALVQGASGGQVFTTPVTFTVGGAGSGISIKMSSPTDGQQLYAPPNIPLAVTVTDPAHSLTRVEYCWCTNINGGVIATSTQAPWTASWATGAGDYILSAIGYYAGGAVTSAPVHVTVVAAPPLS